MGVLGVKGLRVFFVCSTNLHSNYSLWLWFFSIFGVSMLYSCILCVNLIFFINRVISEGKDNNILNWRCVFLNKWYQELWFGRIFLSMLYCYSIVGYSTTEKTNSLLLENNPCFLKLQREIWSKDHCNSVVLMQWICS